MTPEHDGWKIMTLQLRPEDVSYLDVSEAMKRRVFEEVALMFHLPKCVITGDPADKADEPLIVEAK